MLWQCLVALLFNNFQWPFNNFQLGNSRQHLLQQQNLDNAHAEVIIVRHSGIAGLYSEPKKWQNGVEICSLRDASIYCGAVL